MALPNWFRRCVGCGAGRDKKEMVRIAKRKNLQPEIDFEQRMPGRGAYICPKIECANLAKKQRGLDRSLHCAIDEKFYDKLIRQVKSLENRES